MWGLILLARRAALWLRSRSVCIYQLRPPRCGDHGADRAQHPRGGARCRRAEPRAAAARALHHLPGAHRRGSVCACAAERSSAGAKALSPPLLPPARRGRRAEVDHAAFARLRRPHAGAAARLRARDRARRGVTFFDLLDSTPAKAAALDWVIITSSSPNVLLAARHRRVLRAVRATAPTVLLAIR